MDPTATTAAEVFRNLIRYDSQETPFVDRYSQFGVVFDPATPLGAGTLQLRSSVLYQAVADALLTLWIESDGGFYRVSRRELVSLPWEVSESGRVTTPAGTLTVSARHVFLDETRMLSEFSLAAPDASISLHPIFSGQLAEDRRAQPGLLARYGVIDPSPRSGFARHIPGGIEGGLISGDELFLPSPAIRITRIGGISVKPMMSLMPLWARDTSPEAETSPTSEAGSAPDLSGVVDQAIFYEFDAGSVTIPAGGGLQVSFVTELSVATYLHRQFRWKEVESVDADDASAASQTVFLDRVSAGNPPTVPHQRSDQAWRARWALSRTGYRAHGPAGEFGELTASTCVPNSGVFTRAFFWDALFSSAAMGQLDPEFARGAILSQFIRQTPDGYCPEHLFNYTVPGRSFVGAPQAPVASWAVDKYLSAHPDDVEFLREVYPLLVRNHRYWQKYSDRDRDGLAEWSWTGQTADNSPLWDEVKPQGMTGDCNWIPPIASVQLNSFLYRDAVLLASFASELDNETDAGQYRARAGAIEEALMKVCYLPGENRFWDYNHITRRHTRVKTFYMVWPIWAGMQVPSETRRDLIENVLLDPAQFFGAIPFPSVAYNEPTYDSGGYWRGRAWPHITYWILEMLAAEGYADAADEAAARFLAAYDREPSFPENINTNPSVYQAGGVADYNWGIAAYLLIADGRYRRP